MNDIEKQLLDEQVREIIEYHFNPNSGSEFWINFAKERGINPIHDITCYEELKILGNFNADDLRTIPVEHFIPKDRLNFKKYDPRVFETGGTSGIPKRVMDTEHQKENAAWICDILQKHGFREKGKWINLFPSGPHAVSLLTYHMAKTREEIVYSIDIDPRWVKVLIKKNQSDVMNMYINHVMDQVINIIKSQDIKYLFITSKLLEYLMMRVDLTQTSIKGIVCGGTKITSEFYKFVKTEAAPGIDFCALYGNTLMGVAPQVPSSYLEENSSPWSIQYYPYFPHFYIEIVDKEDHEKYVHYGEEGRVKLTVLNKDVFIPSLLERDVATRVKPCKLFSWDGVANVGSFQPLEANLIEGVY